MISKAKSLLRTRLPKTTITHVWMVLLPQKPLLVVFELCVTAAAADNWILRSSIILYKRSWIGHTIHSAAQHHARCRIFWHPEKKYRQKIAVRRQHVCPHELLVPYHHLMHVYCASDLSVNL